MRPSLVALGLVCVVCALPVESGGKDRWRGFRPSKKNGVVYFENFDDPPGWWERWNTTRETKYAKGKFEAVQPKHWKDSGISLPVRVANYCMSASVDPPLKPSEGLVFQFEVKHSEGHICGGSYLKLMQAGSGFEPSQMTARTPFVIMFGPDRCNEQSKVHLVMRHRNAKSGVWEDKHLARGPFPLRPDTVTHVYTLHLYPNHTYAILMDDKLRARGSLLAGFEPPMAPPQEVPDPSDPVPEGWVVDAKIPDPTAKKPANWDDRPMIPDEYAVKPAGWRDAEPAMIPDPDVKKPEDWSDEEDGPWKAPTKPNPKCSPGCGPWKPPLVKNPTYRGPWRAPLIDNPAYEGPYVRRTIPNPHYYEEKAPLDNMGTIGAVAIELWTADAGFVFDNIIIAKNDTVPKKLRERMWKPKFELEKAEWDAKVEKIRKELEEEDLRARILRGERGYGPVIDFVIRALESAPMFMRPLTSKMLHVIKSQPRVVIYVLLTPFSIFAVYLSTTKNKRKQKLEELRKKRQRASGGTWVPVEAAASASAPGSAKGGKGKAKGQAGAGGAADTPASGGGQSGAEAQGGSEGKAGEDGEEDTGMGKGARRRARRAA